ncbi:MAG: hypothetical protein IPK68_15505 [Bdellovibrionales bacterium]|nr:hypothetical protein [Bdellovibrionales bacterium]
MFRLIPTILLILISTSVLATPPGDRPPTASGACQKALAKIRDQSDQSDQNKSALLKELEELNARAESQLADAATATTAASSPKPTRGRETRSQSTAHSQSTY